MKKSKGLVVVLILVVLQIFCLFLPTYRSLDERRDISESYSAIQMIINFSDTIHDPDAKGSSAKKIVTACESFNVLMVGAIMMAIVCTVSACAMEDDSSKKALSLLCIASVLLATVPLMEGAFLGVLCDVYGRHRYITTFGVFQIIFAVLVVILVLSNIATKIWKDEQESWEYHEQCKGD